MKKIILLLSLLISHSLFAQTMNSHISSSLLGVKNSLEGKRGTMVLTPFENGATNCATSKMIDSIVSSSLAGMGVKTSLASRALDKNADQAELSRVAKLSGGSFILKGSYSVVGDMFSLNCTVMDHNGNGIGACTPVAAVALNPAEIKMLECPEEKTVAAVATADPVARASVAMDDYICSVLRPKYDFKKLLVELHKREFISLDEMRATSIRAHEDLAGNKIYGCVELGGFTICGDSLYSEDLLGLYSDRTSYGQVKIKSWLHYEKEKLVDAGKCLKFKNGLWNK